MEKNAFASQAFAKIATDLSATSLSVIIREPDGSKRFFANGYASVEEKRLADERTIFRIASISKIEVALCFMKQVELGKADPDEDISRYLGYRLRNPHFPDIPITAAMLMTQSSSVLDGDNEDAPAHHDGKGYEGTNGRDFPVSLERLLTDPTYEYYTERTWGDYKPGTVFHYSNFGAGILACVVERLTGKLFTDVVREVILSPLGMDASFRADEIKHPEDLGDYYEVRKHEGVVTRTLSRTGASFIKTVYPKFAIGENYRGPAGGLFTSLCDLAKIMDVFLDRGMYGEERVFSSETIDRMEQIHFIGNDERDYRAKGYQLKVSDAFGLVLRGHTGGAYGITSTFFFNPENDFGVLMIANGSLESHVIPEFSEIFRQVIKTALEIYLPSPFPLDVAIAPDGLTARSGERQITLHPIAPNVYPLPEASELLGLVPRASHDLATFTRGDLSVTVRRDQPVSLAVIARDLGREIVRDSDGTTHVKEVKA